MGIPDYQTLMLPVLAVAAEGETRVALAAAKVAEALELSEVEREEMLPSGKQRLLHNRIHSAKFYMVKAGLVDTPKRGVFIASSVGKALLATHPTRIDSPTLHSACENGHYHSRSSLRPNHLPTQSALRRI